MGGMMVFGIVLVVLGLSVLFDLAVPLLIAVGIIVAIVGGVTAMHRGVLVKLRGAGLIVLGITVALTGVFMELLPNLRIVQISLPFIGLWNMQSVIKSGGMIVGIIGVIMAGIGLIGMFKGDDDRRIEKVINGEQEYETTGF